MEAVTQKWNAQAWTRPVSDEAANSVTHGAALVLSVWGLWQLLSATAGRGTLGQTAGVAVFGGSMVVLYLASTLYHAVERAGLKRCLRVCDHSAIYLLIAGTHTPFLLAQPRPWSTWCLAAIWLLAAAGVGFKLTTGFKYERLSVLLYLAMSWFGVLAIPSLVQCISAGGVAWLISGGLAYTCGTLFYVRREVKYAHAVWHVFVALGTALHYGAIVFYVVPRTFA